MRILVLCQANINQVRDGTSLSVYNRWKRLGKKHDVTMLTIWGEYNELDPGIEPAESYLKEFYHFRYEAKGLLARIKRKIARSNPLVSGYSGETINPEAVAFARKLLKEGNYDLVQAETFPLLWLVPDDCPVPLTYHANDVISRFEYDRVQTFTDPKEKQIATARYERLRKLEQKQWQRPKAIFTVTETEAKLIKKDVPNMPVHVAAHGVDLDYLSPTGCPVNEKEVVFIGALDVRQNEDAALWYATEAFPKVKAQVPDAQLTLVGRKPPQSVFDLAQMPGVTVHGDVPDVRPFLERAGVVIAPVRLGAGMKAKTGEAMSMKKAIIVHPVAADGTDCVHNENCMIAETTDDFINCSIELLNNPAKARQLGETGRKLIEDRYSWESIVDNIEKVYKEII